MARTPWEASRLPGIQLRRTAGKAREPGKEATYEDELRREPVAWARTTRCEETDARSRRNGHQGALLDPLC